jgi:hypothetical protein
MVITNLEGTEVIFTMVVMEDVTVMEVMAVMKDMAVMEDMAVMKNMAVMEDMRVMEDMVVIAEAMMEAGTREATATASRPLPALVVAGEETAIPRASPLLLPMGRWK